VNIIHIPVLKDEVYSLLKPEQSDELLIDATVGEGGHAEMFLEKNPRLTVVGIDADSGILKKAETRLSRFGKRVELYNRWFNLFFKEYPQDMKRPDKILFDLGISSYHYEESLKGFTFQKNEPLDMRLEEDLEISAADIINQYPEEELADLIYEYSEERYSRRIARAVVTERAEQPIETTDRLENIIWKAVPEQYRHLKIHPATRTFQALRIAVNGELARLKSGLQSAFSVLGLGGRIGVITFHSLEDRIVKYFFREKSRACTCPPEWPICKCGGKKIARLINKKPIRPTEEEVAQNPASRSAKLRVIEKIDEEEL
jgi:16S rRNA (cytosine1402-N4)-methyltransferase